MKTYDLIFKGALPGGRAIKVRPFRGSGGRPDFLLPAKAVTILSERVQEIGQVALTRVVMIRIPDNLALANELTPEDEAPVSSKTSSTIETEST